MAKGGSKRNYTPDPSDAPAAKKPKQAAASAPAADTDAHASESLYVRNLTDQVSIADLRAALYMLFSSFGHVVALNAHKSPRMRGQAHVAFGDAQAARAARTALQGRQFFSRALVIEYAKAKSHRLAWLQRDLDA